MPTVNPRINVTLSPSMDQLVTRLAALERVSKATILRELLETAEPALAHAAALMEAADNAGAKARENVAKDMQSAVKAVEGATELALQNMAFHAKDLVSEAQSVKGRRPKRWRAPEVPQAVRATKTAKRPPSSNRGVKS